MILCIDTTTDKSVMEGLLKDISEMSLHYIDQEAIKVLQKIGQGKPYSCIGLLLQKDLRDRSSGRRVS